VQIVIPTRGRTNQQITLSFLPPELRKRTTLVCPKHEGVRLASLYEDVEIVVQPESVLTIAKKREWIVREWLRAGYDKIIMLDDDLTFFTRKRPNDTRLWPIQGDALIPEFKRIEDKLGPDFPHVGFDQRKGNNWHKQGGWKSPGKICTTLGYYLPVVSKCRFDLVEVREDYCVALQLLLKGYPNAVWTETAVNWLYDAPGGISTQRTVEKSNAEARKLKALFPDYVSVVQRNYKAVPRLETMCQWKKALEYGLKHRR
jgi:hypothetical protein